MMRKRLTFLKTLIAAVAVILLFTACEQFLKDPEDFLSYWASEAFIKDHSIDSAVRPDGAGVPCVSSSEPVDITLTVHNPKNFPLVMPISSAPAGIVEFKELSSRPEAETDYELKQTGSGMLKLTYKPSLLQKYEQGSAALNPTITLKAKDGRVFKQTYTFGIKSNSPPPKPKEIVIAKTKGSDSCYVLCLKFNSTEMEKTVTMNSGTVPVHKDIEKITIKKGSSNNGSSYELSYNGDDSNFQQPAGNSFITHGDVAKLTEDIPQAEDKWVLYFKTNVLVESSNEQTSYTITLSDREGVTSDSITAELRKRFKVTFDSQGGSTVPDQYIEKDGKVTRPTNPTKEGYDFIGWYKEASYSTQWDFDNNMVTENITLYAKWTEAGDTPYKVKHYQETVSGGTYTFVGTDNESGTTGANAAYTPKAYEGFTHQSGLTEINGTVQQSGTINADGTTVVKLYYKRNEITVTFNLNGGKIGTDSTSPVERKGKYDAPLTAPTVEKNGYTFSGWQPTPPAPSLPSTFPAVNAEYTAQWTPNTYYVRFNGNGNTGGSMSDQTFTYGQSQQLSANGFIKTGHTFDGWATSAGGSKVYDNQQSVSNLTTVANGTVNLYAKWTANTYTVTFRVADGKGGTLKANYGSNPSTTTSDTVQVTNGDSVSFTATPDNGWEVDSWKVDGITVSGQTGTTYTLSNVTGDKTVTVKFKPGELHFNSGGPDAWKRLKEEAAKTEGAHTIVINGEITATTDQDNNGKISIRRELIIKSSGSSASLNASNLSGIFDVNNKLTLENITLKNGAEPGNRTGAGAYVNSTLIMKGSSTITDCSAHKGGGVYISNGTLIMQDSSAITNCEANDGGGVYVAGTFKMEGSAIVTPSTGGDENVKGKNDVYLESGRSITVTGTLTKKPAARITPDSYTDGRVLATGSNAEKANFKVTPKNGSEYWRYKKVGNEIKFVPATLTVTFTQIKCVEEHDDGPNGEYYWTMKVDGEMISERKDENGKDEHGNWKRWVAGDGDTLDISEKSFTGLFKFFPANKTIPVNIEIYEDDDTYDDHIGTTKAHLTYDYDNDQWKWEYDGNWISGPANELHGNQKKNSSKTIGDGGEEIFTEQYRHSDGDTDVTIKISWKE